MRRPALISFLAVLIIALLAIAKRDAILAYCKIPSIAPTHLSFFQIMYVSIMLIAVALVGTALLKDVPGINFVRGLLAVVLTLILVSTAILAMGAWFNQERAMRQAAYSGAHNGEPMPITPDMHGNVKAGEPPLMMPVHIVEPQPAQSRLGVNLDRHCQQHGYAGARNKDNSGNGWVCTPGDVGMSVDQACEEQHGEGFSAALIQPGGANDWVCLHSAGQRHHGTTQDAPQIPRAKVPELIALYITREPGLPNFWLAFHAPDQNGTVRVWHRQCDLANFNIRLPRTELDDWSKDGVPIFANATTSEPCTHLIPMAAEFNGQPAYSLQIRKSDLSTCRFEP